VARPKRVANGNEGGDASLVRFEGEPGNAQALVPIPPSLRLSINVAADLPRGRGVQIRTLTAPLSEAWTTVRLLLPVQTPAGEYDGELTWSGGKNRVVIAVRSDLRVLVVPPDLRVSAAGGGAVTATVVLHNAGNVDLEVRKVYAIALEHHRALDRAIIAGLTSEQTHLDRFGAAAESLVTDQAGVVRAVTLEGAGAVSPGEARQLVLELRMPESLESGTTYSGTWLVGGLDVPVVVDAVPPVNPGPSRPQRARAARKTTKEKS